MLGVRKIYSDRIIRNMETARGGSEIPGAEGISAEDGKCQSLAQELQVQGEDRTI